jgi:hypothetical protein
LACLDARPAPTVPVLRDASVAQWQSNGFVSIRHPLVLSRLPSPVIVPCKAPLRFGEKAVVRKRPKTSHRGRPGDKTG